jgi:hypothetical protein
MNNLTTNIFLMLKCSVYQFKLRLTYNKSSLKCSASKLREEIIIILDFGLRNFNVSHSYVNQINLFAGLLVTNKDKSVYTLPSSFAVFLSAVSRSKNCLFQRTNFSFLALIMVFLFTVS